MKTCWSNFKNVMRVRKIYMKAFEEYERDGGENEKGIMEELEEVRQGRGARSQPLFISH